MMAIDRIKAYLSTTTLIAPLIVFRIIFGALLVFGTLRFLAKGWVETLYIQPSFHFPYLGLEWVKVLPGEWMYLPFILCLVGALGILFGLYYRLSALTFFLSFTYVELIDKSYYLNHYYFVSLIAFLLIFMPAHRAYSLDVQWRKLKPLSRIPRLNIDLLKFQIGCVYVFAGIAKINSDWLMRAEPLHTWLQAHHQFPVVGPFLQEKMTAFLFSWAGCLYDLFIVFFLLWNRTRQVAYCFVIGFHLLTWYLFPIGVFPWVMIGCTLLFFSAGWHANILKKIGFREDKKSLLPPATMSSWAVLAAAFFILFQLLIPFRYLAYSTPLFWTEEGFRFSWRVMLMHKEGHATFYVRDRDSGREIEIQNGDFLTRTQEDQMATQPDMILQYANHLKQIYNGKTFHFGDQYFTLDNPTIHARIHVSLNGRPSALFVDSALDLSHIPQNLKTRKWIAPSPI